MTYFPSRKILTMKFGSHLYGTNTPSSDLDFKSVFIPSGRDILLGRVKDTVVSNTKVNNAEKNTVDDVDDEAYSLQKFLKLLSEGQTVALDMLFAPRELFVETNPSLMWIWDTIYDNRHRLITKKSESFIGYCRQQANKYGIKGSRMHEAEKIWQYFTAVNITHPSRTKVGEFEFDLMNTIRDFEHTEIIEINTPQGTPLKHLSCCGRKVPFTVSIKEAQTVYENLFSKYGERARLAKNNDAVDWKAVSHAIRVGTEAIELAKTGKITFPLPNREYCLDVKLGKVDFEETSQYITDLLEEVEVAFVNSALPEQPDYEWIDNLVMSVYHSQFKDMNL